jgi:hypothetical protein
MAKVQIPPPAGYWDVIALLRVLAEPEVYQGKLEELEALRAEIEERSECEETWERVKALEADAKAKLAESVKALDAARLEATKIRTQAEADAVSSRESLKASREEWAKARAKEADDLAARGKAIDERERAAREATEKAKTALSRGEYLMREAMQLQTEYTAKVDKLKGIVS